jgi:hypothetical protein
MTREPGALMAETRLAVEHREHLWSLLVEAAQYEQMIMCQYLYACFSLRTGPDEGPDRHQADAVARWQKTLTGIAIEEMLHLALVMSHRDCCSSRSPSCRRCSGTARCDRGAEPR